MKFVKLKLNCFSNRTIQVLSDLDYYPGPSNEGTFINNIGQTYPGEYFTKLLTALNERYGVQGRHSPEKFVPTIQESV